MSGAATVEDAERAVRELLRVGEVATAATEAIRRLGPRVYGYLRAVLRDEDHAAEAFGETCAAVWQDLGGFDGPSLEAWMMVIARHRVLRAGRAAQRARRHQPLSGTPALQALADEVRTATPPWRRTEGKDQLSRLRATLAPDDQTLLILRIDRTMAWAEIATILEVTEATARKRYERLLARLRKEVAALRTR